MRYGGVSPHPWQSLNHATSVGDSRENIVENRKRSLKALELEFNSVFDVWQVHGDKVVVADSPRPIDQPHQKADAILTKNQEITLLMLFADCVPIFLVDPIRQVFSIAHAGWKGTLNNVAGKAAKRMIKEFHSSPEQVEAYIGPCICQDHYQVGQEVVEALDEKMPNARVLDSRESGYYLDLPKANQINLQKMGVKKIFSSGICTSCNNADWFSHRAENGKTGRYAAILAVNDEAR